MNLKETVPLLSGYSSQAISIPLQLPRESEVELPSACAIMLLCGAPAAMRHHALHTAVNSDQ